MMVSMSALLANPLKLVLAAAAAGVAIIVVLLALDGWMKHGTDIFLSAVQNGIAWCF
jgi:hypothetical protein